MALTLFTYEWIGSLGVAETEAEAEGPISNPAEGHIKCVLHHDIHFVLVSHAARLKYAETFKKIKKR